jgi:hypothetical protein
LVCKVARENSEIECKCRFTQSENKEREGLKKGKFEKSHMHTAV